MTKPIFFSFCSTPNERCGYHIYSHSIKGGLFFLISLVRGVKHITRAKILNKTPPDTIFFSFLFYPEKLGGFIRFHPKRVTSCGNRTRTCDLWVMSPTSRLCSIPLYFNIQNVLQTRKNDDRSHTI